ncbi:Tyrosine-protein kinase, partial [Parasponia andersonii]
YAMGSEPSRQGDVYSYGILVLEMFTGRRPTDEMFKDDYNLHNFVKMALSERVKQIVDPSILYREIEETEVRRENERNYYNNNESIEIEAEGHISPHLLKCLVSILEIGVACSKESPDERMSMEDVPSMLEHIKNAYMGFRIHEQNRGTG